MHVNSELQCADTTRRPRPGEIDGLHYRFVKKSGFSELASKGELLEHGVAGGHMYGTPRPARGTCVVGANGALARSSSSATRKRPPPADGGGGGGAGVVSEHNTLTRARSPGASSLQHHRYSNIPTQLQLAGVDAALLSSARTNAQLQLQQQPNAADPLARVLLAPSAHPAGQLELAPQSSSARSSPVLARRPQEPFAGPFLGPDARPDNDGDADTLEGDRALLAPVDDSTLRARPRHADQSGYARAPLRSSLIKARSPQSPQTSTEAFLVRVSNVLPN